MARFDPATLSPREVYGVLIDVIVPRPIAWTLTVDRDGRQNLAPFSFFNGISARPPLVSIAVGRRPDGRRKDTAENAIATEELVVHLVDGARAEAMNATSADLPPGESEVALTGLATVPSERVAPPRLAEAPVAMECRLVDAIASPGGAPTDLLIARVLLFHVADAAVRAERPGARVEALDPIGRLGGDGYCRLGRLFGMERPS